MRLSPLVPLAALAAATAGFCTVAACASTIDTATSGTRTESPAAAAPASPSVPAAALSTPRGTSSASMDWPAVTGSLPSAAAPNGPIADAPSVACALDTLRSSVQALAPDFTTGVQRVKVYNCVSGFARLYAIPNPASDGTQLEGDQFFLQFITGEWKVLVRGAGIDCGDNNPKLVEACAAFD